MTALPDTCAGYIPDEYTGGRRITVKALAGTKSQPDNTGGCMLALYPPTRLAKTLAVPDGLPVGEVRLTVAYAGDAADVDPAALNAVAGQLARRSPVTAAIAGHARFTGGGGDNDVIVALADGSGLEDLRRDAMDRLSAHGIAVPRDHGYTPHLTLRYADPGDPDPVGRLPSAPVTFAGISAVHGGDRTDYPFAGDLAESPQPGHTGGAMGTPAVKALFAEARHPRGHDGKFIEIGGDVTLPGGLRGKVTGMHGNRVLVDAADGTHRVVPAGQLASAPRSAAHGGFRSMHAMHAPVAVPAAHGPAPGGLPWAVSGDTAHYHDNLGIDRGDMPQLSGTVHGKYVPSSVLVPKFIDQMRAKGVPVTHERVAAGSLKPTQATGGAKTIRGIADSIKGGTDSKPVIISSDNRVLDGHHTWAGHVLAGKENPGKAGGPGMNVIRVGLPIKQLIGEVNAFGAAQGIGKRKTGVAGNPAYASQPAHAPVAPLTAAEYEARRKMVESKLNAEITAGHATDRMHTIGGNGETYTPDRAALHKQIVGDMLKRHEHVPNEGKGVIAGGLGGAGKSTTLRNHAGVDTSKYMTLNPDDVKEEMARRGMIPHVPGLSPMEASPLAHEETSRITNMAAQRAYAQKKNLIWDITMSSHKSAAKRVDDMRKAGYGHVRGVFVDIPAETSVQRALARHQRGQENYAQGKGHGGRYVPPELIRKSAGAGPKSANRQAFETVRHKFNQWDVYDNSVHGRAPQHIEWSHHR